MCNRDRISAVIPIAIGLALSNLSLAFPLDDSDKGGNNDSCFSVDRARPNVNRERGELNRFATRLPQPKYPSEAKAKGICGEVVVEVVVDMWSGKVYWARITTGHPLLEEAVKKVVCQARFAPTVGEGPADWVGGTLKYRFRCRKTPPNKHVPAESAKQASLIVP